MKKEIKSRSTNLIIFIAILVFINLVSQRIFTRFDLTEGNIYSLSEASKKVIKNLDSRLVVKAYFSKELPSQVADSKRFTRDLLAEYQAYSHGKFRFEFVDPAEKEKLKEEARKNRIQPATLRVNENDKLVVKEVYLGLAFFYEDQTATIPLVQNTQGLEYDITSKIKKITEIDLKKIAFFGEEEEMTRRQQMQGITGNYEQLKTQISENYEIKETGLEEKLDEDVKTLIFAGIKDSLSENQLFNLDQFIMKGGNVIFFQEKVSADIQTQKADVVKSNLFPMLNHYGIEMENNLVLDASCGEVQVRQQQGMFNMAIPVKYPFLPILTNVNQEHEIVKNLDQMQMVYASEIKAPESKTNLNFEPLIYTSDNSGQVTGPRYQIGYQKYFKKDLKQMFNEEKKVVAALFSGKFQSYFAESEEYPKAVKETDNAQIILVSDSDFIKETSGGQSPGNKNFTLNALDYLSSNSILIGLRSREVTHRPLKEVSNATRKVVKWLNILLPSILLIIYGIFRYKSELRKRKHIGELYE